MVDRETTEDKEKDVTTESLAVEVELNIEKPTQAEQPVEDTTEKMVDTTDKPSEELAKENSEAQTKKPATENSEKSSETQIEKPKLVQVEAQVQIDTVPPAQTEKHKPLFVEMQTQTDLPEVEQSKEITTTSSMAIVKIVGQTSRTTMIEFKPTNVIEVLLDSIKKIME